jgi:RNA polymerase sigma factor FliA
MTAARDALIRDWEHLVPLTRLRVCPNVPRGVEPDDLESVGYLGLVRAADRYDPARGAQFPTLAITWIGGAMLQFLRDDDWVPRRIRQAQRRGEAVVVLEQISLEGIVYGEAYYGEGISRTVLDDLPDPGLDPEELCLAQDEMRRLWERVASLRDWERQVIEEHYLLGLTFTAIAARMDLSGSRIGQIHQEALRRLERGMD